MSEVRKNAAEKLGPKKENTFRILAVGDSITEGSCASNMETKSYPALLQDLINENALKEENENGT
mgnify:CR=1 FL=1